MFMIMPHRQAMDGAVRYFVSKYNPKGNRIGWLTMASMLVEVWEQAREGVGSSPMQSLPGFYVIQTEPGDERRFLYRDDSAATRRYFN